MLEEYQNEIVFERFGTPNRPRAFPQFSKIGYFDKHSGKVVLKESQKTYFENGMLHR